MKMDVDQLWSERFEDFWVRFMHYWRLILSSGWVTPAVLFILATIYYPRLIEWIPNWFPLPLAFSVLLAYLVTRTVHRTFLKEADLLFLLPLENKMERFFSKAFSYNFGMQSAILIFVLIVLMPMYVHKVPSEHQQLFFYFVMPIALKGWNLQSNWTMLRLQNTNAIRIHSCLRFVFNLFVLAWFFSGGFSMLSWPWHALILVIVMGISLLSFYIYERQVKQAHAYHWLFLIDHEARLNARFYRWINAFVDVPHLQNKVKKRGWISAMTRWLSFHSSQAYRYLYLKTFLRANEYLGIYVRLTVIGGLVVYFIPDRWGVGIAFVVFLFMTTTQIRSLWGHHDRQFWTSIFPLPHGRRKRAFIWLSAFLMAIQAMILLACILAAGERVGFVLLLLVIGVVYVYGYHYWILNKKLAAKE